MRKLFNRILRYFANKLPRKPVVHCRMCIHCAPTVIRDRMICLHPESAEKHNQTTTYWFMQQKTCFDARFTSCRQGRLFVKDKPISQKIYEAFAKDNPELIIPLKKRPWTIANAIADWKHRIRMRRINKAVNAYLREIEMANRRARRSKLIFK